eukprot:s181_g8.t1
MVAAYTFPTTLEGRPLHLKDGEEGPAESCRNPGGEGDGTAPAGSREEGPLDEKEDDTQKWKDRTFMEILPDRKGPSVIAAVSRLHARLRYLGLPLLRLHSDRAAELRTKSLGRWAEQRQVMRTYTDGDAYKMNGRAESAIKVLKGQVRTLLKETGQSAVFWPAIAASQPSAVSATSATQNEGRCRQVPHCHAKRRQMSTRATPATQKRRGATGDQRRPRTSPEPAQCRECHACHTKRKQMSPSATPATHKSKAAPRLPHKVKADVRQAPRLPRKRDGAQCCV